MVMNDWRWRPWLPLSEVLEKSPTKQHPFQHVEERASEYKNDIVDNDPNVPDFIIHFVFIFRFVFFSLSFLKGVRGDSFCVILAHVTSDPSYLQQSIEWWSMSELKYSTFKQYLHTLVWGLKRVCEQINNLPNYCWKWDILLTGFFHKLLFQRPSFNHQQYPKMYKANYRFQQISFKSETVLRSFSVCMFHTGIIP